MSYPGGATTSWAGRRRIELDSCASTNDAAAGLARDGAEHGTVVVAREQTAGRGRLGRTWHSPAGENLYLSLVVRPEVPAHAVPSITLAAGLAVIDAVNSAGVAASLKWPNDVLARGRKLAGILTEMSSRATSSAPPPLAGGGLGGGRSHRVEHVIVGIGVNLDTQVFPDELDRLATSLAIETGGPVDRAAFEAALLAGLSAWIDRWAAGGVAAIAEAWMDRARLGPVKVVDDGQVVEGEAVGLDGDGALIVIGEDGARRRVTAGDVVLAGEGR